MRDETGAKTRSAMKASSLTVRISAGLSTVLMAGCSLNPRGAFNDVANTVGRASGKRVSWIRNGEEAAEAHRAVETLLARPLTADSAVQIALVNNRALQAEFEEIGISYADYIQAGLPQNPSITGHIDFSRQGQTWEYSVAQDIISLLLLPLRKKIAAAQLETTKKRVASEVLGLLAEAKTAFYTLQARQQLLGRLKLIVETNEAAADIAKRQHDAGNISDLDLANQAALYNQSRIDVAQTEAQIRSDTERLNRLMGVWGNDIKWRVGDSLPSIPEREISSKNLEKIAVGQRLDLAMARANVDAVGKELALRTSTRFTPVRIDLGLHGEKEPDSARRLGPSVDLEVPIFDFGQAAIARLQAQWRQAIDELHALAVDARSEIREARDLVSANRELANYYGKILLPQRVQIVNQTQLQYNAMQVGPIDLLQAKERELDTERAYVEVWRDYWIARAELERALWGGSGGGARAPQRSISLRKRNQSARGGVEPGGNNGAQSRAAGH
jgi:cobalt-zinc-cadmium efflux system outer membrane protein